MARTHGAQSPQRRQSGHGVVRQSGLASVAATVAVGSGLLLDVVTAVLFGAGAETDAYVAAARLPFALTAVLMVISTQVLVPTFTVWFAGSRRRGHRLSSTVLYGGLAAGLIIAVLIFALADPLLWLLAPGFAPWQHRLAAELSRIMVFMIPLTAGSEVLRAWLNARRSYMIPAGMTLLLNLTATLVVALSGGSQIRWLPIAYVIGAAVQFLAMLVIVLLSGLRLRAPVLQDPEIVRVGRLLLRPSLGAGLNPLARIAETFAASFLPSGSMTIVNYGNRLVSAIGGTVLFRSVMVAILPRLTRAFHDGRRDDASSVTGLGLRLIAAVSLPLTTLGVVLAVPATNVLFNRGEFAGADAELLGASLAVYSLSFLGSGLQRVLLAPFYAIRNTTVPLANTVWGVVANMALLPLFVLPVRGEPAGVLAIAAAYALAQYVNVAHAWWSLRRASLVDLKGLQRPLLRSGAAAVLAGAASALVVWASATWIAGWEAELVPTLVGTSLAAVTGIGMVLAVEMSDPVLRTATRRRLRRGEWQVDRQPAARR